MNAEILQAVQEAEPQMLEKVALAIQALEHIDQGFAAELVQELSSITEYTHEKIAGADMAAGWKPWAVGVGGAVAGGLALSVAGDLYDAARRGLTKGLHFRRIMNANPDLQKFDQTDLKRAYSTFHRYAPEFTADPNLGGQILRSMTEIPQNQRAMVKDLLGDRKNLREVMEKQLRPLNIPLTLKSHAAENDERAFNLQDKVERMRQEIRDDARAAQDAAQEALRQKGVSDDLKARVAPKINDSRMVDALRSATENLVKKRDAGGPTSVPSQVFRREGMGKGAVSSDHRSSFSHGWGMQTPRSEPKVTKK